MTPWIDVVGWTLIHFVWQGGIVAVVTALALHACRRRSANIRYVAACAGLVAMLGSALATATVLRTGRSWKSPAAAIAAIVPAPLPPAIEPASAPAAGLAGVDAVGTASRVDAVLPLVVWVWLAGVAALLVRFSGGCWRVHRLRIAAQGSASSRYQAISDRLAQRLRVPVAFRVVESTLVDAPAVLGWLRPVVLLPVAALAGMSPDQIEALIAHELAHIRRRDYLVNLVQTMAEALLFFHPGVWWVSSRIRQEREHCCDDAAVAVCGEPAAYAEALAALAAGRLRGVALSLGAADGSLLGRIRRLVDLPDEEPPRAFGALIVALGVTLAVAAVILTGPSAVVAQTRAGAGAANPQERSLRETDHFVIHYPPALDLHADRVAADAERAYERVSADVRHNLGFKVGIVLFATGAELRAAVDAGTVTQPHSGPPPGGSSHRILFSVDQPADRWSGLLTHEVTHVFGFDIVPGAGMPAWIAEGLAEYERGAWDPGDLSALRDVVRANAIPSLVTIQQRRDGQDERLVHAIGHAAFDFIESRWGKAGIRQLLLALRQNASSGGDPFAGAFQLSADQFSQAFERYLRSRFSAPVALSPGDRFDSAATRRIEGAITSLRFPVAVGLACLELLVEPETDSPQRWGIECGEAPAGDLIHALRPGEHVIITGSPARQPDARRLAIRRLERPSDGFTWLR